jgi:hypothetical protein
MDTTKNYGNSSFWMDRFARNDSSFSSESEKMNNQLYKLASQKRAIANFVSIVTNQRIPVKFASTGDSYTDGDTVVISSRLEKESEFDVAVGLALHEGSHIKLSDFKLLQSLATEIYNLDDYRDLHEIAVAGGVNIIYTIKDILNWVEDRRIDNYIYKSSPGYRAYYQSLYDKYFNDSLIDTALSSNELTSENFESYMFRLINLHSKYSRLNALKGLKEIWNLVDLKNISRLTTTKDALDIAVDIFRIICKNVEVEIQKQEEEKSGKSQDDNSTSQSNSASSGGGSSKKEMDDETFEEMLNSMGLGNGDETNNTPNSDDTEDTTESGSSTKAETNDTTGGDSSTKAETNDTTGGDSSTKAETNDTTESGNAGNSASNTKKVAVDNLPDNVGDVSSTNSNSTDDGDGEEEEIETISLTDRQKDILGKKIQKQKDFLNGDISKTKLSKKEVSAVEVLEKSGAEIVEVGSEYEVSSTYKRIPTIGCILVKNMSMELLNSDAFPFSKNNSYLPKTKTFGLLEVSREAVEAGIRLGSILGRKMQVRSESRDTIFNRQLKGKLDKRMVASLGYGNTQTFYTKETDMYNKVNLHISVDASSSMGGGDVWNRTMTNVVALAKAVDMISNLDLQISFRSTDLMENPYIVIAYDSKKDKFTKIKQLFPYLRPYGITPEGLCFEAIQKYMIGSSNGLDSYFLNISDGDPYYYSDKFLYSGYAAAEHTKKMMDGYRKMGIGVLSYFVSSGNRSYTMGIFTQSYGKSAKFIDVTSVNEISKSMNELFMKK